MDGLTCPLCGGAMAEPQDGVYLCTQCERKAEMPYTQDGTVYYNKPASRLKAMCFPAISLVGVLVLYWGWAPLVPTLVATALAYVYLDSLVWASGGGASKFAAIMVRLLLVTAATGAYWHYGT